MAEYKYITVALNTEYDSDLIQALDAYEGNRNDLIKRLLRDYFFGPQINVDEKAHYKLIQLENKLNEIKEEYEKRIAELERELILLKQAYEKKKQAEEEEKRKREEEERAKVIEEVKRELKEAVNYFEHAGSKIMAFYQIRRIIKDAVEKHGLSEEELWEFCFSLSPRLRQQAEIEVRRCFR